MSGGVDSAVAAALVRDAGHEVEGVTLKLWGGVSDSGCCSLSDVEDARSVARRLGLEHHVFNYSEVFESSVVGPYVEAHAAGCTPNPCIECNRHVKFGRLLERAGRIGFDAVATGHHARTDTDRLTGERRLLRGLDPAKDQSYVLSMLTQHELERVILPIGELAKSEVRTIARDLGLRVAEKRESQDVCFVASRTDPAARAAFIGGRVALHAAAVIDARSGEQLGAVPARELVTVGQRRGIGPAGDGRRRYVVDIDPIGSRVFVGSEEDLLVEEVELRERTWVRSQLAVGHRVELQCSAHGRARRGSTTATGARFDEPSRRVAPGQTVAIYDGDEVLGSGIAA